MKTWNMKPEQKVIERTIAALKANGIEAELVQNGEEARNKALSYIPEKAEVLTMTSITLESLGIAREINESGRYDSVRKALTAMNPKTQEREQRKLGAAPDFTMGSVHAVTESGTVLIASLTGSQLPAYVYAGGKVIWVVGVQKIVKNMEEGLQRINEYLIDKESERAIKAYGLPADFRTFPSRVLLYNRELVPGRIRLILVNEVVGH